VLFVENPGKLLGQKHLDPGGLRLVEPHRAIAGIAPYRARGGVNSIGAAAFDNYQLTKHWSVAALVNYGVLQGDAADSPVTTNKTQRVIGAFAAYGF
jgi:outer membrane scaffolding protein for murein synthesis (MipA/OmpV family)